jgi:hypothetical protein
MRAAGSVLPGLMDVREGGPLVASGNEEEDLARLEERGVREREAPRRRHGNVDRNRHRSSRPAPSCWGTKTHGDRPVPRAKQRQIQRGREFSRRAAPVRSARGRVEVAGLRAPAEDVRVRNARGLQQHVSRAIR